MRLHEILDLMYETNEVQIMERPQTQLFDGKVRDALKADTLDISRTVISVRPIVTNKIRMYVE